MYKSLLFYLLFSVSFICHSTIYIGFVKATHHLSIDKKLETVFSYTFSVSQTFSESTQMLVDCGNVPEKKMFDRLKEYDHMSLKDMKVLDVM